MNDKTVVVIGAGRMGMRHVEAAVAAGLRVVGLVDRSTDALEAAAGSAGLEDALLTRDPQEALALQPETLVAATTTPGRVEVVEMAVAAGVTNVLCEKPMGTSLAECDRMIAFCAAAGVNLAVNHQMRYMDIFRKPAEMAASEEFGGISGIQVSAGNFGLAMNGTHYFETFRYVTGETPVTARARLDTETIPNPRGPEFFDTSGWILLTTASGKRFFLDTSAHQGHGIRTTYACQRGMISVDDLSGELTFTCRDPEFRDLPTTRYGMPGPSGTIQLPPADATTPTRHVLEALVGGGDYPTGADARLAIACLVAATVSSESGGEEVAIDDHLPQDRTFPWA